MIPYEIDPSLHGARPAPPVLDDGFSPPPAQRMATHPVEPEPLPADDEAGRSNPSHLPVEPEFAPMLPPAEPEDPGVKPPHI